MPKSLNVLSLTGATCVVLVAALGAAELSSASVEIAYERFVLPNGLRLIVHEDHKAPIVAVNIWYHVGSKNEKPGKTGFAHLFEHLMFNGSEHYNDDYFKVLERIGATDLNGTTNFDRTNYFQNIPVSALDTVLWMESDRMGHLLGAIDQARLDEQRGVVQNEKRQGENQPYGKAFGLIFEGTYPKGHPYSWSVIGSMEDLSAASLEDVRQWFKDYYGPSNAVLVVAGDVKAGEVRKKVEHYFGDIPPGPPLQRQTSWVAGLEGVHRQVLEDRVPQARIYRAWPGPEFASVDNERVDLVTDVLASGKTSRLFERLVYRDQIATDVNAFLLGRDAGGLVVVSATARPGTDLAAVERALDEEMARLLADGPTAEELARVKTEFVASFLRGIERIGGFGGKSDVLAQSEVMGGGADHYKARLSRVASATADDLRSSARRWLKPDGVYVLEVRPFAEGKAAAAGADRARLPEPGPPPAPRFPAFERARLANGLEIVLAPRHAAPLVTLRMMLGAGYAADHGGKPGTAALAGDLLDEGTLTRSSLEIAAELARLGATLATASDVDTTNVTLSAVKASLGPSLELFADVILRPSFPQGEVDRIKKEQIARIQREKVSPVPMALRVLPRLIYGADHPYGNPFTGSGMEAVVETLTREELARFHATWFKPGNATLVVAGDVTLDEVRPKLEALFGGWKPGEVPRRDIARVGTRPASEVYVLDRPGALQSVIIAGQVAPPKANPQEIAIEAMNTVLGGQFISRVNMNLREGKHWSYGAFTLIPDARGQRPFIAYAPVQTDKTKESLLEVLKELKGIRGEAPVTPEELKIAQDSQTLALPGRWETNAAVVADLAQMVRFGLGDQYYATYPEKVRALSVADVNKAAELVEPDRLVWVVVGDRAKIESGVTELALGPVRVIDADGNVRE